MFPLQGRSTPRSSGLYQDAQGKTIEIRDVWAHNLHSEFAVVREVVQRYPYVAMDTEFPGVPMRPVTEYESSEYQYQTLRCNVDCLKIIQIGLAFSDGDGHFAPGCPCWQFNFEFSLSSDMYAKDSIELLRNSGINFERHEREGINVAEFGELLMVSGLVLVPEVSWVTFHSSYDFGYLMKILINEDLPSSEQTFLELLITYFPNIFDVKTMMNSVGMHGGLSKLGDELGLERIGTQHTAGSDALLTSQTFFSIVEQHLGGWDAFDKDRYRGEPFGFSSSAYNF
jgi:CCR4-NOT transcription complex subunit 7/8